MIAALGPFIMRHPDVKNNMEQFMLQHVAPEFSSSEPYMRAIVSLFSAWERFEATINKSARHDTGM
jgi:hypothetical protein